MNGSPKGLVEGKPAYQAYIDAGFAKVGAAQSASRLLKSQRAGRSTSDDRGRRPPKI
jgi:hypothetical protein